MRTCTTKVRWNQRSTPWTPDRTQIYLCSLSKILGPGLRLGYVLARPPMLGRITARRDDAGSNTLAAAIAAEFYAEGIWHHARRVNRTLRGKRDRLLARLEEHLDDVCVWSRPPGGLFVWVRLPEDVDRSELWRLAQADGVAISRVRPFICRAQMCLTCGWRSAT